MLTREQYFPGHSSDEQVALFIRRHWMAFLAWPVLAMIVLGVTTLAVFLLWQQPATSAPVVGRAWMILFYAMFTLSILFILLRAWMSYYLDVTIVTERRLVNIEQHGIFVRRISEQSLLRVQDVSARQSGALQHFLQYGSLYIETAGDQPNFELKNIPRPREIAQTILNLHDRLIEMGHGMEVSMAEGTLEAVTLEQHPDREQPRHPLEELRPYFPEPGQGTPNPVTKPPRPSPTSQEEGVLAEGETIVLPTDKK